MQWNKDELEQFIECEIKELWPINRPRWQIDMGPDERNCHLTIAIEPSDDKVSVSITDPNHTIYAFTEIHKCLSIDTDSFYNKNDELCKQIKIYFDPGESFKKGLLYVTLGIFCMAVE